MSRSVRIPSSRPAPSTTGTTPQFSSRMMTAASRHADCRVTVLGLRVITSRAASGSRCQNRRPCPSSRSRAVSLQSLARSRHVRARSSPRNHHGPRTCPWLRAPVHASLAVPLPEPDGAGRGTGRPARGRPRTPVAAHLPLRDLAGGRRLHRGSAPRALTERLAIARRSVAVSGAFARGPKLLWSRSSQLWPKLGPLSCWLLWSRS